MGNHSRYKLDQAKDWRRKRADNAPRGRWKIERQLRPGGKYTVLRMLAAGVGPAEADAEFRRAVEHCTMPGATSRAIRLVAPGGESVDMVDVSAMRRARTGGAHTTAH